MADTLYPTLRYDKTALSKETLLDIVFSGQTMEEYINLETEKIINAKMIPLDPADGNMERIISALDLWCREPMNPIIEMRFMTTQTYDGTRLSIAYRTIDSQHHYSFMYFDVIFSFRLL